MKLLKAVAAAAIILPLSSCVGEEPDNLAYVTALGIDKSESGYYYTIQFAQPTKISGGAAEEGGSVGNIIDNLVVEAPTLYSAINVADTIISKDLSMSHAKLVVVSEEVARDGLGGICDVIIRNNDINDDIHIAVTENADDYIEKVHPAIELNPVKYYQLTLENKNGSAIPQNTAYDFYTMSLSGERDCVVPLAGVADAEDTQEEEEISVNKSQELAKVNKGAFDYGTRNYYAGQTGKKLKNKSEVLGAAVFRGTQYIDKIGSTETETYNILMAQFRTMNINVSLDGNDTPISLRLTQKTHPRYIIDKDNKTVDIYISLDGTLLSECRPHDHTPQEIGTAASAAIDEAAAILIDKAYKTMQTDILGIKGRAKKKFLTVSEHDAFKNAFRAAEWRIVPHTRLTVKSTGTV